MIASDTSTLLVLCLKLICMTNGHLHSSLYFLCLYTFAFICVSMCFGVSGPSQSIQPWAMLTAIQKKNWCWCGWVLKFIYIYEYANMPMLITNWCWCWYGCLYADADVCGDAEGRTDQAGHPLSGINRSCLHWRLHSASAANTNVREKLNTRLKWEGNTTFKYEYK